jgi:hypothetical protein
MTDSDLLARAARALRDAHTGERQGSGFTRARIMSSLHRERRRRVLRWVVVSPIASLLLVGSAWAQTTGKWPVIWKAVASVFTAAPASDGGPLERRPNRDGRSGVPPAELAEPPDVPSETLPEPATTEPSEAEPNHPLAEPIRREPPPTLASPTVPAEPRPSRPHAKRRPARATSSAAERPEPSADSEALPSEPAPDREIHRFRAAHDLHFAGNRAREAVQAYAEYLREFPNGRFVPEARYNGALDQIKLGNEQAAREALAPFAAGRFGGYRQKEARELLDALERKQSSTH